MTAEEAEGRPVQAPRPANNGSTNSIAPMAGNHRPARGTEL